MSTSSGNLLSAVFRPGVFHCRGVEDCGESTVRLKRFGICAGRKIEVVHAGNPMVLQVCGTRVGVSRELSRLIEVEEPTGDPVAAGAEVTSAGDC